MIERDSLPPRPRGEEAMGREHPALAGGARYGPERPGHATPEERAEFVIRQLERFIRENRTVGEGVPFRHWQEMARTEIANAIIEAQNDHTEDLVVTQRLLISLAAALVTIGFWGTLLAFEKAHYLTVALICGVAGIWLFAITLEWPVRKWLTARRARVRTRSLRRIESLTRRIKRMEKDLEREARELERGLTEMVKTKAGKSKARIALEGQLKDRVREMRQKLGA